MFSFLFQRLTWTAARNPKARSRRPSALPRYPKPRARSVPRLEALEDRTVPSGGYAFSTIDHPDSLGTVAGGIDASGKIVGYYRDTTANAVTHGFLLRGGRQYTTLDDPNAGTGSNQGTFAIGINASGSAVGFYEDANSGAHGFVLSNGQYTTLDDPNAVSQFFLGTEAYGINASGKIVGFYVDANFGLHGFLLSGGQYTTLDEPNAAFGTLATGINASEQIVGSYTDANFHSHGFLLRGGRQYTSFDDPNGVNTTSAYGINDSGQVVGYYYDASGVAHGFLLSGGQYTTLDDPNAGTGFAQGTQPIGINDAGQIVGLYFDASYILHGFLATPMHGTSVLRGGSDPGADSGLASADAGANMLIVAAAFSNGTPLGYQTSGEVGGFGAKNGHTLGEVYIGKATIVTVLPGTSSGNAAPSRDVGLDLGGRIYLVSKAAAAGVQPGSKGHDVLAITDDISGDLVFT